MRNTRHSPSMLEQRKRYGEITKVRIEFEKLFWQFNDSDGKPGNKDYLCEIVFQLMDIKTILTKNHSIESRTPCQEKNTQEKEIFSGTL